MMQGIVCERGVDALKLGALTRRPHEELNLAPVVARLDAWP